MLFGKNPVIFVFKNVFPKKSIKERTIKGNPILKEVFKLSRFGLKICIIVIFP
jgi:hypothetical protein